MQDSFIEINSVPTRIITWGHHVNQLKDTQVDKLIVLITGIVKINILKNFHLNYFLQAILAFLDFIQRSAPHSTRV